MMAHSRRSRPFWSQALRALREARGMTQEGWASQLGYGRATVRRWESGETVPSADAEAQILHLCSERALLRRFSEGPLAGIEVTREWLSDLLATARLEHRRPEMPVESAPTPVPTTHYALSGDVAIAYQVFGSGPIDLVVTPGLVSHRELEWEHPGFVRFFNRLASFARVIIFDKRGTGMSDRVEAGTLEERVDDIRAVMDAAGSKRAALFGVSEGGPMSILFAATYPHRTQALALYGAFATHWHPHEHPVGPPPASLQRQIELIRQAWGTREIGFLPRYAPSVATDPAELEWWARYHRISASPGAAKALIAMNLSIDVRHVLPAIRVPALVLHRRGDLATPVDHGRYLAESIPGARYLEFEGDDHLPMYGDVESLIGEVASFLDEPPITSPGDSVLATILSIDAPCACAGAAATSHDEIASFQALARRELVRYRGREVRVDGNRVLASFDGPTRAVRCATAVRTAVRSTGIEVRAGLHTGEVHICNDEISGLVLDISQQISNLAEPGEILVSSTVVDLIPGSGFEFAECEASLSESLPGSWRLFCVADADNSHDR